MRTPSAARAKTRFLRLAHAIVAAWVLSAVSGSRAASPAAGMEGFYIGTYATAYLYKYAIYCIFCAWQDTRPQLVVPWKTVWNWNGWPGVELNLNK